MDEFTSTSSEVPAIRNVSLYSSQRVSCFKFIISPQLFLPASEQSYRGDSFSHATACIFYGESKIRPKGEYNQFYCMGLGGRDIATGFSE